MTKKDKKKDGKVSAVDPDAASPYPNMELAQRIHRLTTGIPQRPVESTAIIAAAAAVFEEIGVELENPSLYKWLLDKLNQHHNESSPLVLGTVAKLTVEELQALDDKNKLHAKELEKKIAEAVESAGDMEVMDTHIELARFAAKSLSRQECLDYYEKVLALSKVSSGKKIDSLMACARVASFYHDTAATDEYMDRAHTLAEAGGGADWDRRNRLKVYRALRNLLHRDVESASKLLLDCIATFSCTEICTYTEFIVYTVLTNMLHLPRPELKEKIIDGPEVLSVSKDIPVVIKLVQSYYDCDYKAYLHTMVEIEEILLNDRYLQPHASYWLREMHILAYKQFLDSYQSVTLQAMADAFGVSTDFIDFHASRFIAANRLSAKIDKYGGVIVTNRPDLKNAQYREMIQKGDLLLNRIQKLARVVDL